MATPRHRRLEPDAAPRLEAILTYLVDAGLAAAVFAVPLMLGGRLAVGQLVLVAAALFSALCWCAKAVLAGRTGWIRSGAEPILVAALVWVGIGLLPLGPGLLRALSGGVYERLPLWTPSADGSATLGVWSTLSLNPASTQAGLVVLAAFVLLFFVTVQRVRRLDDVERLLRWIAWATATVAVLGLLQYFFGNGKYFGFYQHRGSAVGNQIVGSFTNRNHFAHFMALGVGPLLWWVASGLQSGRGLRPHARAFGQPTSGSEVSVVVRAIVLGLVVFAGLASLSRGGVVAIVVALAVGLVILYQASMIRRKTMLALAASGAALGGGLLACGYESLAHRLDSFQSIDRLDPLRMRRDLWAADLEAVGDFPLAGTGLGTHVDVAPLYLPNTWSSQKVDFTHAECGYLQVALETGIPGLLLALAAAGLFVFWCAAGIRRADDRNSTAQRRLLCFAAIVPGLAASLSHSLVDFVWYVPGLMVVVVILAACACRLWQGIEQPHHTAEAERPWSRAAWTTAGLGVLAVGLFMANNRLAAAGAEPSWQRYLLLSDALAECDPGRRRVVLEEIAGLLDTVVRWDRNHARAHAELAEVHRELFADPADAEVCPLDVRQVREAVLASRFPSSAAMFDWLRRAFGPRCRHLQATWRHAREAVSLCPLLGQAYLCLADVSFLEGPAAIDTTAYVEQAIRARPLDGRVLFAAGQEAFLTGDHERALGYWKGSFRCGRQHQRRLLQALGDRVAADELLQTFEPDRAAMEVFREYYVRRQRPEEMRVMWRHYAEAARQRAEGLRGAAAAAEWMAAAGACHQVNLAAERLQCLQQAVRCDPANYDARRDLALALLAGESFDAAEEQLTWCLRQKPDDAPLRAEWERLRQRFYQIGRRSQDLR